MILKALTLENFKGIRERVRIEFAPLTLLFGPNNAGKSTIVQALMYAREVLERNNCDAGRTALGGDVVDLGGFDNLVYGHERNRVIRMRFELDLRQAERRHEPDWVRENELDAHVTDFYSDAPRKLDLRWPGRLSDVWVQIEIGWNATGERPVVRTYSVGIGSDEYARISLGLAIGEASLSHFNFGIYPFGTRYDKGNLSDFEWEFAKEVRKWLRQHIANHDLPELGVKAGAYVGMVGEAVRESKYRLARDVFDGIVAKILAGDGNWGDSSIDEETGEHRPEYVIRQSLIDSVNRRAAPPRPFKLPPGFVLNIKRDPQKREFDALPTSLEEDRQQPLANSIDTSDTSNEEPTESQPEGTVEDEDEAADDYDWWEERIEEAAIGVDHELDSWMLELFVALIRDGYVPLAPDDALPLTQKASALPEWGRTLSLNPVSWRNAKKNEFWPYPQFAEEHFKDLLTEVIVEPGEILFRALCDAIYLSPFRAMPPRHFQPARSPDPRRWADGLAAWDWLLLKGKDFASDVNQWLSDGRRFNAGYEIDLRRYREMELDSQLLAELMHTDDGRPVDRGWLREQVAKLPEGKRLQIRTNGVSLFPQDLGVGVSQIIPVIVAALHNTSGIVAIEEPESNIHPAFQVVLADLFLTQAKANPNVLFLIETHSEHLMLRCLRRIRETSNGVLPEDIPSVSPDDVAVHFVNSEVKGPKIERIQVDEDGDFVDEWPGGFFEESFHEKFAGR
jgi:hypothetical protein